MSGGALPNLVIIGALKCATTPLGYSLRGDVARLRAITGMPCHGWRV